MDEELRRGLKQLLDYQGDDVEDVFYLTFESTWTEMAEKRRVAELKPDGVNIILVTKANKEEFVLAAVRALGTCGQRKNTVGPLPNWRDAHYGRLQPGFILARRVRVVGCRHSCLGF